MREKLLVLKADINADLQAIDRILDIQNVRPRLLSDETYQCLDELRRFRHRFRSLYTSNLDVERLRLVLQKARTLEDLYRADTERFLTYLDELG